METDNTRIKYVKKIYSPPTDTPRKKKQNKKESDSKLPAPTLDIVEPKLSEPDPSVNPQLVQYVFKLKHQLSAANKELKNERDRFKHLITSISKYMGNEGENFLETINYRQFFQPSDSEIDQETGFEKLFTTHKYQVTEKKTTQSVPEEQGTDQKSKTKSTKTLKSSSLIKINLKDMEVDKQETMNDKDQPKRQKKRKASSPIEEDKAGKKKKVKKNNPIEASNSENKDGSEKMMGIPIIEIEEDDKVKKVEDTINKYNELAHKNPGLDPFDMIMQNNLLNQSLLRGMGYNPLMPGGEQIDQNKLIQELIKKGIQDPLFLPVNSAQDFMNYYQRSFKS